MPGGGSRPFHRLSCDLGAFLYLADGSQGRGGGDDNSAGEGSVARDGDDLLFSSAAGRRKVSTVERDARVGLTVYDRTDPLRYLEARGNATVTEDLSRKPAVALAE